MSKFTTKFSTPLIRLLLIDPLLPEKVRNSTTTELIQWINEIGLEDSAEIMAFASSQQIEAIFDIDLWAPQIKGGDEKFNPSRFGTWLEILTEININRAVDKIIEMDEEFISMAFSSLVWVAETSWLEGSFSSNSQIEKIIDSKLTFEIDNYLLFAKTEQNWDAFISIIIEMDSHHHSFLYSILERCANFMIQEARTGDELFDILNDEDQLIDDVTFEREKRRETQGFVTP
ncbi:MAG: hypothetical protein KDD45_02810 [Bdellovibrionales bacterium]|nr:hypothetical protein [Bdellovibrionales bacterium]